MAGARGHAIRNARQAGHGSGQRPIAKAAPHIAEQVRVGVMGEGGGRGDDEDRSCLSLHQMSDIYQNFWHKRAYNKEHATRTLYRIELFEEQGNNWGSDGNIFFAMRLVHQRACKDTTIRSKEQEDSLKAYKRRSTT